MPLKIYRLRRLLAATAVLLTVVVAGMYFYARHRATDVLKQLPGKIGIEIKQTANGYQYSQSIGKRTLFTIQAGNVKEFKLNGNAELHNVSIILYGRDSSRFDQISGDDFAYNQKTGDVTAKGEVQIDLVANPAGLASPDQSTPKEVKNPIHLKTRDLVFNKETGNATTEERVDFRTPQATGWAMGVSYAGKTNLLTLSSQIHIVLNRPDAAVIDAESGVITGDPRLITLEHPHLARSDGDLQADHAVFYLGAENQVDRVLATGHVTTVTRSQAMSRPGMTTGATSSATFSATTSATPGSSAIPDFSAQQPVSELHSRADQAEFLLEGKQDLLHTATLTGNVHIEQTGAQPMQGDAGRVILDFAGQNQLQKVHALDGARLTQKSAAESTTDAAGSPRDFELSARVIDFNVVNGHVLEQAETSGAAQITMLQTQLSSPSGQAGVPNNVQRTVVTAGKFHAQFAISEGRNHLTSVHGAPHARIVSSTPGQPDRVSTSDMVDARFLPQGGIESIVQQGNLVYTDGLPPEKRTQASANSGLYTPADQLLTLTGSPRVTAGSMATTARTIRMNRATGEALAQGDVKSTYSQVKEQPDGALLASASPIHVTAQSMTARNTSGIALYSGDARLWQDANIIQAPSIQFDRDKRFVTAQGTALQPVQTVLVQAERVQAEKVQGEKVKTEKADGTSSANEPSSSVPANKATLLAEQKAGKSPASLQKSSPIFITAAKLTYSDSERKIHYEGGVVAKAADFTASAKTADAYLLPRSQTSSSQSSNGSGGGPGQLDHMVALGDVLVQQPNRRANGQQLVYTAASDKFVLTGGASGELPSIFDAEQGKITGVSLTFFRADDRVLVEGEKSTPVVTQTRVAR